MKDFSKRFDSYKSFKSKISNVIGYKSEIACDITDDYIEAKWYVRHDELTIIQGDDEYVFTISSYAAKGQTLFCGGSGDFFFVMAYIDNWELTSIYILRKSNRMGD